MRQPTGIAAQRRPLENPWQEPPCPCEESLAQAEVKILEGYNLDVRAVVLLNQLTVPEIKALTSELESRRMAKPSSWVTRKANDLLLTRQRTSWRRYLDKNGRPWLCDETCSTWFFEDDPSWKRYDDTEESGWTWWANQTSTTWFFDPSHCEQQLPDAERFRTPPFDFARIMAGCDNPEVRRWLDHGHKWQEIVVELAGRMQSEICPDDPARTCRYLSDLWTPRDLVFMVSCLQSKRGGDLRDQWYLFCGTKSTEPREREIHDLLQFVCTALAVDPCRFTWLKSSGWSREQREVLMLAQELVERQRLETSSSSSRSSATAAESIPEVTGKDFGRRLPSSPTVPLEDAPEASADKVGKVDRRQRSHPHGMSARLREIEAQIGDLCAPPVKPKEDVEKLATELLELKASFSARPH